MARSDPNTTFAGYAALALIGGVCALPEIGIVGLLIAASVVYSGACFMGGYTAESTKRRRQ